jgi:hypothetical protein
MLGEITPQIAEAIASSQVPKMLLPVLKGDVELVGLAGEPLPHLVTRLVDRIKELPGSCKV